jgi:hypothetical protein
LILQSAKKICGDESYVKVQEIGVKEDGGTPKMTCKYEIFKDYPQDMMVSTVKLR